MFKKITLALLLTVIILAFPIRLLGLTEHMQAVLKIAKGLVFISIIFFLTYREGLWQWQLLLRKIPKKIWLNLLPVILIIGAYLAYFWARDFESYDGSIDFLLLTLLGTLVAASAEEVVFRGYIFNLCQKHNYSLLKSLVLSSICFSLIHIVNIFRFEDAWAIFNQLIFAFALGMLFGSILALTNNLLLISLLHFLINIPSSIKRISKQDINDLALSDTTFIENILSTIFFLLMMLPVLMLAFYYIRMKERSKTATAQRKTWLSMSKL